MVRLAHHHKRSGAAHACLGIDASLPERLCGILKVHHFNARNGCRAGLRGRKFHFFLRSLRFLRRLARRIAKGDWAAYLDTAGDGSFEEVMLQGMVIGVICAPPQEVLARTAAFVPKIDNWSVCDSFCSGLKLARTHPEPVWEFLQPYFEDPRPFAVRFAVVMLLFYYIDAQHLPRVLALLEEVHSDEYYVKMAVAWAASMCYAAFPDETLPWLQAARLDEFTYRRTIRKICESHQVNAEQKSHLRALERRRHG